MIRGVFEMRTRKQALGDMNIIGARVEKQRKAIGMKQKDLLAQLQVSGIDLNASGLSKLEGQLRGVTDYELKAIAIALDVSVNWLLGIDE
jgi:transcriptional regulator with XRE-family HTH domain